MSFIRFVVFVALILTVAAGQLASHGSAQVDLNSDTRRSLEADILEYERLLANREQELEDIKAALGDTASELASRIAERDAVSAELAERRREREQLNAQIAELEARLAATETR
ncbi:MAG TPA: hypothetical protein VFD39_08760, partial [Trueperaceae bacterium]|nr:hypothetical protein [Trueperaceae bacterium]